MVSSSWGSWRAAVMVTFLLVVGVVALFRLTSPRARPDVAEIGNICLKPVDAKCGLN
jgi:hypothetical protein